MIKDPSTGLEDWSKERNYIHIKIVKQIILSASIFLTFATLLV